ncbi:MAG TPA: glycosyltransferase [Bacteroidales bacterium]|nr:glycosyltransferase [Bacteroidales bacterium]
MKDFILNSSIEELILWGVLLLSFIIQLVYYLFIYSKVVSRKEATVKSDITPVSVIICARNESDNLSAHLPIILEQEYPSYEVVVVNDCSSDDTEDVLKHFSALYPHLRVTTIKEDEKFVHGKKLAMTVGIKAAKNEWLLFTDADCMPANRQWIATMQRNFTDDNQIVLGYGGYKPRKGFLNKLIRFDTFFIALQYMGFALSKMPYMGVGRNLAYRKSLFLKNRGFASHSHIASGDDDLFVNEAAEGSFTGVELSGNAYTLSNPKTTYAAWDMQKKRHMSTAKYYKSKHQYLLLLEPATRVLFFFLAVILAIISQFFYVAIGIFIIRLIIQQIIFSKALKKFSEKNLLSLSALFDLILPFINLNLYTLNLFTKKNKWK